MVIDWDGLRAAARQAAERAYAPYSRLRVGAAGQADGRVITGCNVENASYGLTLCAECGLVSALHATGGGTLAAVSVVAGDGAPLLPCGRCRQLLLEAGGPDLLVDTDQGPQPLAVLLPAAFSGTDLGARRDREAPAADLRAGGPVRRSIPDADLRDRDLRQADLRQADLRPGDRRQRDRGQGDLRNG